MTNFPNPRAATSSALQIWVETLANGQFSAWAVGLPETKVTADSADLAIAELQDLLRSRSLALVTLVPENPWLPFLGSLKDDPLFNEWADRFWADKQTIDQDDEMVSIEEMLG